MAKNRRNRGKKPRNGTADAEPSSPISPSSPPMVEEESTDSGGAVQTPSVVVEGCDTSNVDRSSASAHPLDPPETFVPKDVASAMSSPTTFYSAYGSPVSDSTSSQVFDYALTGTELLPTEKIQEPLLDPLESILKKDEIVTDSLITESAVQIMFMNNGGGNRVNNAINNRTNQTSNQLQPFTHDSQEHLRGISAPNNTPLGAGETAYNNGSSSEDEDGTCQAEGTNIAHKPRDQDPDKDDGGAPGPSSSGSVASASTLAPPRSGRNGSNNNNRSSPSTGATTRQHIPLANFTGVGDVRFQKPVDVPLTSSIEAVEGCLRISNGEYLHPALRSRDFTALFSHNHPELKFHH
jgi:hypothetical protein